jgi:diguanylate cyclase (GGDEF)-like protein
MNVEDLRRRRDFGPFIGLALGAVVLAALPDGPLEPVDWCVALGLVLATIPLAGWEWLRTRNQVVATLPAFVYLVSVGFLRDSVGGSAGGLGILVMLPVVWVALHGTRLQLGLTTAGAVTTWAVPLIFVGDPRYPSAGWRALIVLVFLAAVLGIAIQELVMRVRGEAEARRRLADRLEELAATDHLTALPNRRAWTQRMETAMELAGLRGQPLAIALLDLDGLKEVNDTRGHAAGDDLLRDMATIWTAELEEGDYLARLGGDEFALALPGRTLDDAMTVVDRLRRAARPVGRSSAGVAGYEHGEHRSVLLARADAALYTAKDQGGDESVAAPPNRGLASSEPQLAPN